MRFYFGCSMFAIAVLAIIAIAMFALAPIQTGVICAGIGLLGFVDEETMKDENQKNFITGLDDSLEKCLKEYLKDNIDKKTFSEKVSEIMKSIKDLNEESLGKTIDSKTFGEFKNEVLQELVRLKSATEVTPKGEIKIKSLEDQLREQLKDYIVKENGKEVVQLKEACKASPGNKLNLSIVPDLKELTASSVVMSTVTTAGTPLSPGVVFDSSISTPPLAESEIRQFANVSTIAARMVVYAQLKDSVGDAEWVPEGGLKPSMSASIEEVSVTAGKVALTATLTEETLTDLPQLVAEIRAEIIYKIGVAEEDSILFGSGTNGEIKGVFTDIPEFTLTGLKVKSPNYHDAMLAAYTQIVSVSKMNYAPNLIRLNPIDQANMKLTKDTSGSYLFPPFAIQQETLIPGVAMRPSPNITLGEFYMGDFRYLNIRDYIGLTLTIGWVNDDFKRNQVTLIGEKRLLAYIKSNYKTAFVKGNYKTIMEAIDADATPAPGA